MGKIALSDGTQLWYDIKGNGPLLVLNHGYGSSHKNFKRIIPALINSFTCLLWDQRGHGLSDKPLGDTYEQTSRLYSVFQLANDCHELLNKLNFINDPKFGKFFMFGVSMGGMVSQVYAIKHPNTLKALVLASTTSKTQQKVSKNQKTGKIPLAQNGTKLSVELGFTKQFFKNHPDFSHKSITENYAILGNSLIVMPENVFGGFNLEKEISKINIPTMVIHGENDEVMNMKEGKKLGELIPNSEVVIIPDVKHDVNKEAAKLIGEKVPDFFFRNM